MNPTPSALKDADVPQEEIAAASKALHEKGWSDYATRENITTVINAVDAHRQVSRPAGGESARDPWDAIRNDPELAHARQVLSIHEIRLILRHAGAYNDALIAAARKLAFAARTSGGTAGRDEDLCAALDAVETLLPKLPVNS